MASAAGRPLKLLAGAVALALLAGAGWRVGGLLSALAASNAKVLCSSVFVSGRGVDEARAHSLRLDPPGSRVRVQRDPPSVSVSIAGWLARRAVFAGAPGFAAAADASFADPAAHTSATVVVHGGQVVAERYAPGVTRETPLESRSMGKSSARGSPSPCHSATGAGWSSRSAPAASSG